MKKAQLVFIPTPGIGHLVSGIEFAKRILDREPTFSITVLVIDSPFAHNISKYVEALAAANPQIQFINLPRVTPPSIQDVLACPEHFCSLFIEDHKPHVKDAILNHVLSNTSLPVVGLLLDLFCTPFVDVGKELGIPPYIFFTSNAAFLGFMLYLPDRNDKVGTRFKETDIDYAVPSYANPVPYRVLPSMLFHDGGYVTFPNHGRRFKETKGFVVNTFAELESHAVASLCKDDLPPVYTVGPVIDHKGKSPLGSNEDQRDEILKWLDNQPEKSVVYLCFGSQGSLEEPQLREIAIGLEQSGHRFLWSIRMPPSKKEQLVPGDSIDYEEILPDGFLERTKNIGKLCGWAPQVEVLAHKAVAAFVSHCGWNSVLESLWYGVPIVTWPLYGEQQLNAFDLVKDLGLAVELKLDYRMLGSDLVKADEIAKSLKYVLENAIEVRNKAKAVSEKARQALMEGGSSHVAFGRWIEALLANKS